MIAATRHELTALDVLKAYNMAGSQENAALLLQGLGHKISRSKVGEVLRAEKRKLRLVDPPPPPVIMPFPVQVVAKPAPVTAQRDIMPVVCRAYARDLAVLRRALLGLHVLFAALAVLVAMRALLPALVLGVGSIGMLWLWGRARGVDSFRESAFS